MVRLFIKHGYRGWVARLLSFTSSERAMGWERKHPKTFRFIVLRFDPQHFRGLPLTFLTIGAMLNAFILSNLAEELFELSRLSNIDKALANYFFSYRNERVAQWVYFFTQIGSFPIVASVMLIFAGLMLWKKRYHSLISSFVLKISSPKDTFKASIISGSFITSFAALSAIYTGIPNDLK